MTFGALARIIIEYVGEAAYQDILLEVKEWIKNSTTTLSEADINNKMLELIKLRLDEIVEFNDSSNYNELNTIYNGLLDNLDDRTDLDPTEKLEKHKDYAKDYLDSLWHNQDSDKCNLYQKAIYDVIKTSNYKEYIDELSSRPAINGTIDNIRTRIKELETPEETGTTSGATETGGTGESTGKTTMDLSNVDTKFQGIKIKDIMADLGGLVQLAGFDDNPLVVVRNAKENIANWFEEFGTIMKNLGYDSTIIDNTVKLLTDFYDKHFDSIANLACVKDEEFYDTTDYIQQHKLVIVGGRGEDSAIEDLNDYFNGDRDFCRTNNLFGVYMAGNTEGNDSISFFIDIRCIVALFVSTYNAYLK